MPFPDANIGVRSGGIWRAGGRTTKARRREGFGHPIGYLNRWGETPGEPGGRTRSASHCGIPPAVHAPASAGASRHRVECDSLPASFHLDTGRWDSNHRLKSRDSVPECASPLALSVRTKLAELHEGSRSNPVPSQSGRGLPHSGTSRGTQAGSAGMLGLLLSNTETEPNSDE